MLKRLIRCFAASQTKPFVMASTSACHFCAPSFCAATAFARTSTSQLNLRLKAKQHSVAVLNGAVFYVCGLTLAVAHFVHA